MSSRATVVKLGLMTDNEYYAITLLFTLRKHLASLDAN